MPKTPILRREALFDQTRDGRIRQLDWNLVNTSIGAMVEPRQLNLKIIGQYNLTRIDLRDMIDYDKITFIDENKMFSLVRTDGSQLPIDYNLRG